MSKGEGVFNLERDGPIVGGVCCDDTLGVSHIIASNIQLTHFLQAVRNEWGKESGMCNIFSHDS